MPWWSVIGWGGTSFVTCTDKKTVLKCYQVYDNGVLRSSKPDDDINAHKESLTREAFIYQLLGTHPNITTCFGLEEIHPGVQALRLEYAPFGDVRGYIRKYKDTPPPLWIRLNMTLDAARGMSHYLSQQVQHSDFSCRNLLVFDNYLIKICDFGSSLVQGHDFKILNYEEPAYELPLRGRTLEGRPIIKRELFSLGSAIYEIMAWAKPYGDEDCEVVWKKLEDEIFPDLEGVPAHDIIAKCWGEEYNNVQEVIYALEGARQDIEERQDVIQSQDVSEACDVART